MRYYDTKTKGETNKKSATTIVSTDSRVAWWFQSLKNGVKVAYDEQGLPYRYSQNFSKPIVVNAQVREGEAIEKLLESAKIIKLAEIKKAKKIYQDRDVMSLIGGVEYRFFGGLESTRKYKDAMDLAVSLGLEEGTIKTVEGLVSIDEGDMKTALNALSLQAYYGWLKESYYIKSVEEVLIREGLEEALVRLKLIVWEDKRT